MLTKLSNYFREAIHEIKKITWPSKQETINYTLVVLAMVIGVALFLGGADFVFNKILQAVLNR